MIVPLRNRRMMRRPMSAVPRAAQSPARPVPADALPVASYNVHKCVGLDRRRDPERTLRVIVELDADIVALQEADRRFGDRAGLLDLERVREVAGLTPVPFDRPGAAHGWHGNLLLTRNAEVEAVRPLSLPGLEPRGALVVDLRHRAGPLRVIAAHLGLLRASRLLQAQAILAALEDDDDGRSTLLMGDLNEWRMHGRSSLAPLAARKRLPAAVPSFPAQFPVLALDRIIASPCAEVVHLSRHDSPLARVASDHLPVKAWLRLPSPDGRTAGPSAAPARRAAGA
jgi:endonuclease/exonuclease/phosphatase family metal-dependent hydrolase